MSEYESLLGVLSNVFLYRGEVDSRIWKPIPIGAFSSRSFKEVKMMSGSSSLIWLGLAPHRVDSFCWLAVSGKVSTTDVLRRRGLSQSLFQICAFWKERETTDHLFLHWEFSYSLWCQFLVRSGVVRCIPKSLGDLFEAWRASSFRWLDSLETNSFCYFMVGLGAEKS